MYWKALSAKVAVSLLTALTIGLAAAPVHAQLLLGLTPQAQSGTLGDTLLFSGTLSNPTTSEVFLNGESLTFDAPVTGLSLDGSAFLNNAPISLSASGGGNDTYTDGFFSVFVAPSAAAGTYTGTFAVLGGADGNAQTTVASQRFFVTVTPNGAPVPEASTTVSLGLLLGLGGLMLHARRRKATPTA